MKKLRVYFLLISVILFSACGGLSEKELKEKKSAEDALTALKKIVAATEVEINKIEYSKMLIDTQAATNQAIEVLPDGELEKEIKLAMESFLDANTLWNIMKEDALIYVCQEEFEKQPRFKVDPSDSEDKKSRMNLGKDMFELMCNKEGGELMRKYKIPMRDYKTKEETTKDAGQVVKEEGLKIIWKKAKEVTDRASTLYNQKYPK